MEAIVGNDQTIASLVDDILDHYENYRANLLTGKAMIVAYSRPIAMKIYKRILQLRPDWPFSVQSGRRWRIRLSIFIAMGRASATLIAFPVSRLARQFPYLSTT